MPRFQRIAPLRTIAALGVMASLIATGSTVGTGAAAASAGDAAERISANRLLFTAGKALYTIRIDGTDKRLVTTLETDFRTAAVSPDGTRIAFGALTEGSGDIYTMRADGTGVTRVTSSSMEEWHPTWSPDGKYLTFTGCRDKFRTTVCDIYRVRSSAPHGRVVRVTNSDAITTPDHSLAGYTHADWHPSSPQLAVVEVQTYRDGWRHIRPQIRNAFSGNKIRNLDGAAVELDWSPDGTRVVGRDVPLGRYEPAPSALYIMPADGSPRTRLTPIPNPTTGHNWARNPTWSPDGKWIAYETTNITTYLSEVWLVGPRGKVRYRLLERATPMSWSPR